MILDSQLSSNQKGHMIWRMLPHHCTRHRWMVRSSTTARPPAGAMLRGSLWLWIWDASCEEGDWEEAAPAEELCPLPPHQWLEATPMAWGHTAASSSRRALNTSRPLFPLARTKVPQKCKGSSSFDTNASRTPSFSITLRTQAFQNDLVGDVGQSRVSFSMLVLNLVRMVPPQPFISFSIWLLRVYSITPAPTPSCARNHRRSASDMASLLSTLHQHMLLHSSFKIM